MAPPLSAGEADDPGGDFLPLVEQRKNSDGTVNTTVLEQPVDLTNLSPQYRTFATSFIDEHKDEPFFLYLPFSHVHTTMDNQPEKQCAPPPHPRLPKSAVAQHCALSPQVLRLRAQERYAPRSLWRRARRDRHARGASR